MVFCLPYSVFATPLVNAIQDQQKQIEDLKKQVEENADLKSRLEQLEAKMMNYKFKKI
jgi:cell division protein FtsB